jgi:hypothetical protein
MLPISELSALSLTWQQPSAWRREYLLLSDSGTHGRLAFTSFWKEIVEAECGGEAWTFQRTGFFKRQVLISRAEESQPFAVYYPDTWGSGGRLELGGASYQFGSNFWHTRYEFCGSDGQPAVVFYKSGVFRTTVAVQVVPEALRWTELPLLVTLAMVAILLHHQDAATASAAVTAST